MSLLVLLVSALLSLGASACGTGGRAGSSTHTSSDVRAGGVAPGANARSPGGTVSSGNYLNDQDGDFGGAAENSGYHDSDDRRLLALGHTAGASVARAVRAAVERYYTAAMAGDGKRACAMLLPSLARTVPVDYGSSPAAPAYLRGQKTCPAIMTLIFRRSHSVLSAPVAVTRVLVNGQHAFALLGSRTMRASYTLLQRAGRTWTIDGLLGGTMP